MTREQKLLAIAVLNLASEEFGNHGCNDFDMRKIVPQDHKRDQIVLDAHQRNGDPEEFEYYNTAHGGDYRMPDWWVMGYLADVLSEEINGDN